MPLASLFEDEREVRARVRDVTRCRKELRYGLLTGLLVDQSVHKAFSGANLFHDIRYSLTGVGRTLHQLLSVSLIVDKAMDESVLGLNGGRYLGDVARGGCDVSEGIRR